MSDNLTAPPPPSIKGSFPPAEGDWICSQCGNSNYSWRSACNKCSTLKTPPVRTKKKKLGQEIGKQLAEKSRGLFSADDWQCNKCGNVNWARRMQCNVCNAPKYGEVEERTGFGGGYNDRGVVEYKEREESDDEYDEFGRRKRKRSETDRSSKQSKSSGEESDTEKEKVDETREENDSDKEDFEKKDKTNDNTKEVDEDEEDDDEDGDLSKYDLSDWGDIPTINKNELHKSGSRSSSRSRSRSPIYKK